MNFRYWIIGFYLMLLPVLALAQATPPILTCTKVLANGSVDINWQNFPLTTNTFDSLRIYYSNNLNGTYTRGPLTTNSADVQINVAIPLPNANSQAYHFFGRCYYNGNTAEEFTDTISSIYLNVNNATEGFANLSWNAVKNPLLPTSALTYFIYRIYNTAPNNTLQLAGISNTTSFMDSIIQCDDSVKYLVQISDILPCTSESNSVKKYFLNAKPSTPQLNFVTVDITNNTIQISWTPSNSGDATGYELYEIISGTPSIVATINGASTNLFTYIGGTPQTNSESFRIATVDSCNKTSIASLVHRTMFLETDLNICDKKVNLSWNSYKNFPSSTKNYQIFISTNGGAYTLLTETYDTSYIHTIDANAATYKYYIKAVSNNLFFSSTSNTSTVVAALPAQPAYLYLKSATVLSDSLVILSLIHDTVAKVSYYKVLRGDNIDGPYLQVGKINFSTNYVLKFRDSLAFTDERSYFYKVVTIDSCGNSSLESNIGRTIFLKGETSLDYNNQIAWNPYIDWIEGVRYYKPFRSFGREELFSQIANLENDVNSYKDVLDGVLSENGEYCYYILATETFNSTYFTSDSSKSNVICFKQKPRLFVPNAFTPNNDGINDVFYPQLTFVDDANFLFSIYDRWGILITSFDNPSDGWDGKLDDGNPAPPGMYAYSIKYTNISGKPDNYSGRITLIK